MKKAMNVITIICALFLLYMLVSFLQVNAMYADAPDWNFFVLLVKWAGLR